MNARIFETGTADDGSVYSIGNGRVMAYGRGPEWFQAFGPVYTSPNVLSLTVSSGEYVRSESRRTPRSGIWTHEMAQGTLIDCASRKFQCIARRFDMRAPLRFNLDFCGMPVLPLGCEFPRAAHAALIEIPAGRYAYGKYPTVTRQHLILIIRGDAVLEAGGALTLSGAGEILLIGAASYPQLFEAAHRAFLADWSEIFASAMAEDTAFTNRRLSRQAPLREHPLRAQVERAADDVAFLIRAQQSVEGGVQAGHNYHLAYVRDQYGVFRGMLALGCYEQAAAMMRYYADVFARCGKIANAQGMGHMGIFHVHENDGVEITGYLILQALEYLRVTGDRGLFDELRPMMNWALRAQISSLHGGMLSFNGDETYIAGGLVPRHMMWHGSLEATMLMIIGGERYIAWLRENGAIEPWMEDAAGQIASARALFDANFGRDGGYAANCPSRLDGFDAPKCRHGVCLMCGKFGWTHLAPNTDGSIYICAECLPRADEAKAPPRTELHVKSVVMMQPYIGADLLGAEHVRAQIAAYLEEYRRTGVLPSLPSGNQCLGYDFGLLLYAANRQGLCADDLLNHMLAVRDDCGAWVEYYTDNQPCNTRCRPWESGINIEGALAYLVDAD